MSPKAIIKINTGKLEELQGNLSDEEMAVKIGISRTHLWRAKTGSSLGSKIIAGLVIAYPELKFSDIFFIENVD